MPERPSGWAMPSPFWEQRPPKLRHSRQGLLQNPKLHVAIRPQSSCVMDYEALELNQIVSLRIILNVADRKSSWLSKLWIRPKSRLTFRRRKLRQRACTLTGALFSPELPHWRAQTLTG